MKKAVVVLGIIAALLAVIYSQRTSVVSGLMERGLDARMAANAIAELDDGLHLALCGAGGPMPAPNASGPCVAVIAGKQFVTVDAGTDGARNLTRLGFPLGALQGVFLTHFHSDHIDGLGELGTLRWATGDYDSPLPVYGPRGVERVVEGFNTAYAQDFSYRHQHHGDEVAPMSAAGLQAMPFPEPAAGELTLVYQGGGLKVEALAVNHSPVAPAVGYRFSYKDRSLLITGDTTRQANIQEFAAGVDLLVHDALAPKLVSMLHQSAKRAGNAAMAKITLDIPDYHASPMAAAQTARDAGVGHLLYYHLVPPLVIPGQKALFLDGAGDVFPDYTIGQDGVSFSLPAGTSEIIRTREGM